MTIAFISLRARLYSIDKQEGVSRQQDTNTDPMHLSSIRLSSTHQALQKTISLIGKFAGEVVCTSKFTLSTTPQGAAHKTTQKTKGIAPSSHLNTVLSLRCSLSQEELMCTLKDIEDTIGYREGNSTSSSSTFLTLSLLCYGERTVRQQDLTLPHPFMHKKDYFLYPLAEIAPEYIHPGNDKSVRDLIKEQTQSNELETLESTYKEEVLTQLERTLSAQHNLKHCA